MQVSEKILASKLQSAESSSVKLEAPKPPRQPKVGSYCIVTVWTDGLAGSLGLLQIAPFPSPHPTPHRPHTHTHTLYQDHLAAACTLGPVIQRVVSWEWAKTLKIALPVKLCNAEGTLHPAPLLCALQAASRSVEKSVSKTAEASANIKVIQKPESGKEKPAPLHVSELSSKPEPIQMPPSFKEPIFGKVCQCSPV